MFQEANDLKDEWFLKRWTKFTASENYKLLSNEVKGELFGSTAKNYIKQKAFEMASRMWERPELEETKSLLHGRMYEYPAYDAYVKATKNYSMTYMGSDNPIFLEYEPLKKESGGSPDVVNYDSTGKIDALAEIKCPKNPINHWDRLKWKDQWDIKEKYFSTYVQIQNLLLITGAPIGQFISFDERMIAKQLQLKIIDVYPDKRLQDSLHFRLLKAVEEKYKVFHEHTTLLTAEN